MLKITDTVSISETDLKETFIRSPGPGGQHVNKTATAVQLRFNLRHSNLPADLKRRILILAGSRATSTGEVVIEAHRFRSREKNRRDARSRLASLVRQAAHVPKKRRLTRPTRASVEKRLVSKKRTGRIKKLRNKPVSDD